MAPLQALSVPPPSEDCDCRVSRSLKDDVATMLDGTNPAISLMMRVSSRVIDGRSVWRMLGLAAATGSSDAVSEASSVVRSLSDFCGVAAFNGSRSSKENGSKLGVNVPGLARKARTVDSNSLRSCCSWRSIAEIVEWSCADSRLMASSLSA